MQIFDVVVIGGGMVGLSVACGMQRRGLCVAVVEQNKAPHPSLLSIEQGGRVSAINHATSQFLADLGVWNSVPEQNKAPYQSMYVWQKDSQSKLTFDAKDYSCINLGSIVENKALELSLYEQAQYEGVTFFNSSTLKSIDNHEQNAFLMLSDGLIITTKLIVGADGAQSILRKLANIPVIFRDYGHHALITTVELEKAHAYCARQVFHNDGILAILPLHDEHLASIVWSLPAIDAHHYISGDKAHFAKALTLTTDNCLGKISPIGEANIFPLTARYAKHFVDNRIVLVGDAAHTIHPLAGQGANLGFMDARALIRCVESLWQSKKDVGYRLYLRPYERQRKYEAMKMLTAMQMIYSLFHGHSPIKCLVRTLGMKGIEQTSFIKRHLVEEAMGINGS